MNQFNLSRLLSLAMILGFSILFSCSDDDESVPPVLPGQEGFFVVNEGLFGGANASLSFYDRETGQMQNDVFFNANNEDLGDQAQSMTIIDTLGYIVVQNSFKIEVIDIDDFKRVATIGVEDGIESPRYLVAAGDNKAYVSDWGETGDVGTVKVLDLSTRQVTATIPVGFGTNRMIRVRDRVYVTNQGGFNNQSFVFTKDNRVTVINTVTDRIETTIEVGDNPSAIEVDATGNLWVVGRGNIVRTPPDFSIDFDASTAGFISKIAPDNTVLFTTEFLEKNSGPSNVAISPNGNTLYFDYQKDIYTLDTNIANETSLGNTVFIDREDREFYGFSVNPATGEFIAGDAPSFTSAGTIFIYNEQGEVQNQFEVGIGPNGATFK